MSHSSRPHLLGVDDAPFDKDSDRTVPIVAAMLEGAGPIEQLAIGSFPVDGDDPAGYLAGWIGSLRCRDALHGVVLGGITIAGLGVVDVPALARSLEIPVIVANRRPPRDGPLTDALRAAGLEPRVPIVLATPQAVEADDGLWIAQAGADDGWAVSTALAARGKSRLPEPLRVAHLIAAALSQGESRGRA